MDWFGRPMEIQSARRMLASVIGSDNTATVKRSDRVDCYRVLEGGELERIDFGDVPVRSYVTPIVRFDGSTSRHHFSCSFTLTAMLVGDVEEKQEEASSQFNFRRAEEDITDPLACFADEVASSAGSFDTRSHVEYMNSFEI